MLIYAHVNFFFQVASLKEGSCSAHAQFNPTDLRTEKNFGTKSTNH
jgi:hypothetical protein